MENSSQQRHITSQKSSLGNSKSQSRSRVQSSDPKLRYQMVNKQYQEEERANIQKKIRNKQNRQDKQHKHFLKSQIVKKKKELQKLQQSKQNGSNQTQAFTNAIIKLQRDKLRANQYSARTRTADFKAKVRFNQATIRLKTQQQQKRIKKTQAQFLRKVHKEKNKKQRFQAHQYNKTEQIRKVQKQKQQKITYKQAILDYQNNLNKLSVASKLKAKDMDFLIRQNEEEGPTGKQIAKKQQQAQIIRQNNKQQLAKKNREKAIERGEKVLEEMRRQKQYQIYCREAQADQVKFNVSRIETGKTNQHVGVKPLTLSQISLNKKNRAQKQFQKIFVGTMAQKIKGKKLSNFTVVQTKMKQEVPKPQKKQKWIKKPIDYVQKQSLIPGISEGHYSFEQSKISSKAGFYREQNNANQELAPILKQEKPQEVTGYAGKTFMKQTREQNQGKAELYYSQSAQDSNI